MQEEVICSPNFSVIIKLLSEHVTFIVQIMQSFKVKQMLNNLFKNLPCKIQSMRVDCYKQYTNFWLTEMWGKGIRRKLLEGLCDILQLDLSRYRNIMIEHAEKF